MNIPMIINDAIHNKSYKVGDLLGKGGFSQCYKIQEEYSKEEYACKVTAKSRLTKKRYYDKFYSELKIHRQLIHPYICKLDTIFKDTQYYYLLLELCDAGALSDLLKRRQYLNEDEVQRITYEILQAYLYLKEKQIVHRDMKPGNVFLKYNTQIIDQKEVQTIQCKVGDFGLSVQLESPSERRYTLCGTPNYIPPETIISHVYKKLQEKRDCDTNIDQECQQLCEKIIKDWKNRSQQNPQSLGLYEGHSFPADMWSLGCIIYQLLFQKPPFESQSVQETYKRIVKGQYNHKTQQTGSSKEISQYCLDFIQNCLTLDVNERMTVEQAINHPWIQRGRAVKLAYLPVQMNQRADQYNHDQFPQSAFNFQCSITERIEQIKRQGASGQIEPIIGLNVEETSKVSYQEFLQSHYSRFTFLRKQIQLPSPLKFPPTIAQIDPDRYQQIDPRSILQFYDQQPDHLKDTNKLNIYQIIASAVNKHYRTTFHPQVYTLSWIDFSNKYGFAYQLSTGQFGVLFNDECSIIISPNMVYCDVIDTLSTDTMKKLKLTNEQVNEFKKAASENKQIQLRCKYQDLRLLTSDKKFKLVEYFKNYIENKSIKPLTKEDRDQTDLYLKDYNWEVFYAQNNIIHAADSQSQIVYLKQVELNKDGIEKLISNGINRLQENFQTIQDKQFRQELNSRIEHDLKDIQGPLGRHFIQTLSSSQMHISQWTITRQGGILGIMYNNKAFQVNFNDHVKIVIAHSIISLLNEARQVISYSNNYKKDQDFNFQELDRRLVEARSIYSKMRQRN